MHRPSSNRPVRRLARVLVWPVLIGALAGCGSSGDGGSACAVEAAVDSLFWCATAAVVEEDGSALVVAATRPASAAGLVEELVLRFPAPASLPATLAWTQEGVLGAFNLRGDGAIHDEGRLGTRSTGHDGPDDEDVDRHETRVGEIVSGGELVVSRIDETGIAGRFAFTAYGVTATEEQIPVEQGRFDVAR